MLLKAPADPGCFLPVNTVLPVLARCLLAAAALPAAAAAEPPARPNILFLLADDLSWEGVHAASGLDIDTPHLDRLAGRGASFTHAYNPEAARPLFATLLGLQRRHGDALDLATVYPELAP